MPKPAYSERKKKKQRNADGIERDVYKGKSDPQSIDHWWTSEKDQAHDGVFSMFDHCRQRQSRYLYQLAVYFRQYTNYSSTAFLTSFFAGNRRQANYRVSLNIAKSCVDAACALIAKDDPRIFVLPHDGDFEIEEKAKGLQKFIDGQFEAANIYSNMSQVFRDALIFGTGYLYLYSDGTQIKSEQCKVDEVYADEGDGMYGSTQEPQMIYRSHYVAKDKLKLQYPDKAEEIETASAKSYRGELAFLSRFQCVQVVEAWRKPSLPGGSDGRHTLCIASATLLDEPWTKDYFPIVQFFWTEPIYGYRGMGMVSELEAIQIQINATMRNIGDSLHYYAKPRIFLEAQNTLTTQITSEGSTVNYYTGNAPQFITPPAMAADVYQYLQWLYNMGFAQVGLSQQQATSQKPAGLDSAVAMRTYADIGTQRFAIVGKRWQDTYVKVAKILIDMSRDLYSKKSFSVKVAGKQFVETIDWKNIDLDDDKFAIQCFPTNLLPLTPEGRLASVQELLNSGLMPPDVGVDQLGLPILNDWYSEKTASRTAIKKCIATMLKGDKYISPDPIVNLQEAIDLTSAAILNAETNDTDPERIDLLRRFLADALKLQASRMQPQAPAMPPPVEGRPPPAPTATFAPAQ